MALGQKEKALQTKLQMEKFSPDDPYYILGKLKKPAVFTDWLFFSTALGEI